MNYQLVVYVMEEGIRLEETRISRGSLLRNRYWIINIVWSGVIILLVWYILFSGFFVFLFSPFGLFFLLIGVGFSVVLQIRYTMGWSNRLPLFIPKPFGKTFTTRGMILIIITWIPLYLVLNWIIRTNPILLQLLLSGVLALLAFIFGLLILGTWLSLAGLIRLENRDGIRIVKQGDKFIALTLEEIYPPQPGNT
ncbi:MAG: hypothetical protein ACFE8O_02820 [Candidatus Hermodarchaeota archaeon]